MELSELPRWLPVARPEDLSLSFRTHGGRRELTPEKLSSDNFKCLHLNCGKYLQPGMVGTCHLSTGDAEAGVRSSWPA